VADEVEGALLYVDEGAGEALHYIGGLPFVLQLGVRAVCSLENASALDAVNFRFLCVSLDLISSLNEFLFERETMNWYRCGLICYSFESRMYLAFFCNRS
jgi:hypothetical protein